MVVSLFTTFFGGCYVWGCFAVWWGVRVVNSIVGGSLLVLLAFVFATASYFTVGGFLPSGGGIGSGCGSSQRYVILSTNRNKTSNNAVTTGKAPRGRVGLTVILTLCSFLGIANIGYGTVEDNSCRCCPSGSGEDESSLCGELSFIGRARGTVLISVRRGFFRDATRSNVRV